MGDVRLQVADAAVAAVAHAAARAVPGVAALRTDRTRIPDASLVRVTIETRLGDNCRDVALAVQRAVTRALAEQTGRTVRVEVTVADVLLT